MRVCMCVCIWCSMYYLFIQFNSIQFNSIQFNSIHALTQQKVDCNIICICERNPVDSPCPTNYMNVQPLLVVSKTLLPWDAVT